MKNLFHRKETALKQALELHSAGATVRHQNPFHEVPTFSTEKELSKEFLAKWVIPFYMKQPIQNYEERNLFFSATAEVKPEIVAALLGDFNWRTRVTGAYFAAFMGYTAFEEIIGNHLLKSEVCYAGHGYCICLASFNTKKSVQFLRKYLDYYLSRKDLYFDQNSAMAALAFLDNQNNTNLLSEYINSPF